VNRQASKSLAEEPRKASSRPAATKTLAFEDAALVDKAQEGDMTAYGALVAKYQDRIYNLVYRMCGRSADAEELAQETFLKALERIHQFRGNSQFYTWLFRIAANLTISHRRRKGRVKFHSLTGPEEYDEAQSVSLTANLAEKRCPPPDSSAIRSETQGRIFEALEQLEDEFRVVVVLRDIENMDYAGMADVLNVPVGTIKSRLHRARCILRDKLSDLI
jgi:RNA polymerase sigma-70 factor (ECF subfamily)